jgi:acyl carrier protein
MTNLEKYNSAFAKALDLSTDKVEVAQYSTTKNWDSVGHMSLVAILEESFNIMMETDDIINLNSYQKGKEILTEKYKIVF